MARRRQKPISSVPAKNRPKCNLKFASNQNDSFYPGFHIRASQVGDARFRAGQVRVDRDDSLQRQMETEIEGRSDNNKTQERADRPQIECNASN